MDQYMATVIYIYILLRINDGVLYMLYLLLNMNMVLTCTNQKYTTNWIPIYSYESGCQFVSHDLENPSCLSFTGSQSGKIFAPWAMYSMTQDTSKNGVAS